MCFFYSSSISTRVIDLWLNPKVNSVYKREQGAPVHAQETKYGIEFE